MILRKLTECYWNGSQKCRSFTQIKPNVLRYKLKVECNSCVKCKLSNSPTKKTVVSIFTIHFVLFQGILNGIFAINFNSYVLLIRSGEKDK